MNTPFRILALLAAAAGLAVFVLQAWAEPATHVKSGVNVQLTSNQFVLAGEVLARAETSLTIVSRGSEVTSVQVTRSTTITKGAETISLSDIAVGDKVDVTLMRGGDGNLQAVSVAVRTGYEAAP